MNDTLLFSDGFKNRENGLSIFLDDKDFFQSNFDNDYPDNGSFGNFNDCQFGKEPSIENDCENLNDNFPNYQKKVEKENNNNYFTDQANKKTNFESKLLTKKRGRDKEDKKENGDKKNNMGRKEKNAQEKGEHDKFKEDNIMRKIKSKFMKNLHNSINDSITDKNNQLLKLSPNINEILQREYNLQLMDQTIKYLYETSNISSKYKKKDKNENKNLIQKIYENEGNKEDKVIEILNKTYRESYNLFKDNCLNKVLKEIDEEEKNKDETPERIAEYKEKFKNLFLNYEDWFSNKKGRNRK